MDLLLILYQVKINAILSLCLTKYHAMKMYWVVETYLHAFLTSALDGCEWSASQPGHFTLRERAPSTHWIGGWVGPIGGLNAVTKKQNPIINPLPQELNPELPARRSVTILTELPRLWRNKERI
jgi:hypothetical protein